MAASFSAVSDGDLTRMVTRAWREAARAWQEYRAEPKGSAIKPILLTDAEAAEAYWTDLLEEQERRMDSASGIPLRGARIEDLSADRYAPQVVR